MSKYISFNDYCEDFIDQDPALMSEKQLADARFGYSNTITNSPSHKKALEKAKESRKLAKFYGGKALTGSAKQKAWAEDIRNKYLSSDELTDDEKQSLVTCGGFTNSSKFWIDNRNVSDKKMTARNIVKQWQGLQEVEGKNYRTLAASGSVAEKERAKKEIKDYMDSCDFEFESRWF